MTGKSNQSPIVFVSIYIIILLGFFAASFFTGIRLWGLSTWGYLPLWTRLIFLGIGLAAITIAVKLGNSTSLAKSDDNRKTFIAIAIAAVVAGVCFWLFRGQTHFLGDGYGNISGLSSRVPSINMRDFGEVMAHLSLAKLLGGNTEANVTLSYQIISIVAGMLQIVAVVWGAARLYERTIDRLLFSLTILLSGQMQMSFGYTENYSIFVLAVICFGVVGLLAAQGKVVRWVVLIPFVIAVACHVLGVVLVLPAAYLLFIDSKIGERFSRSSLIVKLGLVATTMAVALGALRLAADKSLSLDIALLRLTGDRFTVNGYTLLSGEHLADFANLLLLLVPALLLLIVAAGKIPWRNLKSVANYRFLLLMVGTVIPAAFIFDPKLGMPRDWDLFSFIGVPVAMLFAFALLDNLSKFRTGRVVLLFAIVLAGLGSAARVATQAAPSMALRQIKDYIELDRIKCKGAVALLQTYYADRRDRAQFDYWGDRFKAYPEERLIAQADTLMMQNRMAEALSSLKLAVNFNPMSSIPYKNISAIQMIAGNEAGARAALDTALAISPGNPDVLVGKGFFLQKDGKLSDAERSYIRATELAPQKSLAWFYLARLYQAQGNTAEYIRALDSAVTKSDVAPEVHIELCSVYLSLRKYPEAAKQVKMGLSKGVSRQVLEGIAKSHPELREYLEK